MFITAAAVGDHREGKTRENGTEIRNQNAAALVTLEMCCFKMWVIKERNQILKICEGCSFLSLMHHCCCVAPKHSATLFSKRWGVKSLECGIQRQRLSRESQRAEDRTVAKGARRPAKGLLGIENIKKCTQLFPKDHKFVLTI